MNVDALARELRELNENIILIYAFNATGKTRLSVAYKNATKDPQSGQHAGVYYNAFSEDLFHWDNDEENDGANIRLQIKHSSLNAFHSFLIEDQSALQDKLALYSPKFHFELTPSNNPERGIESVTFFSEDDGNTPIKISRGEERIFVWCFFLALLEVDGWANRQDAHIFVDDPVSSFDECNIFITAGTLFQQIETHYLKKRIIITTHHIGLFAILADRLLRGEKSGRYKNISKLYILYQKNGELSLDSTQKNVFLYHLHLLRVLHQASKDKFHLHHVVLLRQVLESIASFLGVARVGYTLEQIGIRDVEGVLTTINSLSHKSIYSFHSNLLPPATQDVLKDILEKLMKTYHFVLHEDET